MFMLIYIFSIFSLTQEKEKVWPGGTRIPTFRSVAPRVFLAKIPSLAFSLYYGNHFLEFLAHILSWVKTYHHAKFHRNLSIDFARMMIQIYIQTGRQEAGRRQAGGRQTDRQTYPYIYIYVYIYIYIYIYSSSMYSSCYIIF